MKWVNWLLMGCYIWYSEEGPGRRFSPPRPLLAVPNVTAHPSTASVPMTVLLYNGPLLCGFSVSLKGQHICGINGFHLFRCLNCQSPIGYKQSSIDAFTIRNTLFSQTDLTCTERRMPALVITIYAGKRSMKAVEGIFIHSLTGQLIGP